jgi:hypothetical protein
LARFTQPGAVVTTTVLPDIDRALVIRLETFMEEFSNILQRNVGRSPAWPLRGIET